VSAVVLFSQCFHTLVDIFTISHVADGPPEQGADAAERVSPVEGALWRSETRADADEYTDRAITFREVAGYSVTVTIRPVGSLPVPLWVFAPGLIPSPSTWVIRPQGTIHVYVTVDIGFLKEAWSG
jgi:hypothetical protein